MMTRRSLALSGAVLCLLCASSDARFVLAPPVARAAIGHYNGDAGINSSAWSTANGDVPPAFVGAACPAPAAFGPLVGNADNAKAVIGSTWGPILNIGTCVGGVAGAAVIKVRLACANGPTVTLSGGCLGEILTGGANVGGLFASHNGVTCNVPNVPIPPTAFGFPWVAQASVIGGGKTELSSALYGVVNGAF